MLGVHVLRECILDSLNYRQFVELERRALFVQIPILLRDRLMTLGEPGARRDERAYGALAAATWRFALSTAQNGHIETVGSRTLEPIASLFRCFRGPARFLILLRLRRVARVYLRRGRRQGTQDGYQIRVGTCDARRRRRAGYLEFAERFCHLGRAST